MINDLLDSLKSMFKARFTPIYAVYTILFTVIIVRLFSIQIVNNENLSAEEDSRKKEIELKKMSMVEKDIESKRLMDNPIPLPQDKQDSLSAIRQSTTDVRSEVGYLHSEINERLARLEAQTEQKKLEKMLKEIEAKEAKLEKMDK